MWLSLWTMPGFMTVNPPGNEEESGTLERVKQLDRGKLYPDMQARLHQLWPVACGRPDSHFVKPVKFGDLSPSPCHGITTSCVIINLTLMLVSGLFLMLSALLLLSFHEPISDSVCQCSIINKVSSCLHRVMTSHCPKFVLVNACPFQTWALEIPD